NSPSSMRKLTSSTARVSPKRLLTERNSMAAMGGASDRIAALAVEEPDGARPGVDAGSAPLGQCHVVLEHAAGRFAGDLEMDDGAGADALDKGDGGGETRLPGCHREFLGSEAVPDLAE